MNRHKLFSSGERKKLFCNLAPEVEPVPQMPILCQDCGFMMTSPEGNVRQVCVKCGGDRFNVVTENNRELLFEEAGNIPSASVLDEREFSEEPENELETDLKLYSGQTIPSEEAVKMFSIPLEDLVEKGFASVEDDDYIKIHDTAYIQSKLFSKLTISVTKTLELDPIDRPKEDIISELSDRGTLSPKNIMIIRKAHSLPSREFSETLDWISDSGIEGDLKLEFGGSEMPLLEFKRIIDERYDDAPEDIIDVLSDRKIISIYGDIVNIYK